jgi:hypothetical protein
MAARAASTTFMPLFRAMLPVITSRLANSCTTRPMPPKTALITRVNTDPKPLRPPVRVATICSKAKPVADPNSWCSRIVMATMAAWTVSSPWALLMFWIVTPSVLNSCTIGFRIGSKIDRMPLSAASVVLRMPSQLFCQAMRKA